MQEINMEACVCNPGAAMEVEDRDRRSPGSSEPPWHMQQ